MAAKGAVSVALLDEIGKALPGFALDDCDSIRGDSTAKIVTWSKNSDVSAAAGRPVRLQFRLHDAKLFALEFVSTQDVR